MKNVEKSDSNFVLIIIIVFKILVVIIIINFSYNNSLDIFEKVTGNIISYIHAYGGQEKGFNNAYGNDPNLVKGSAIIIDSNCPSQDQI